MWAFVCRILEGRRSVRDAHSNLSIKKTRCLSDVADRYSWEKIIKGCSPLDPKKKERQKEKHHIHLDIVWSAWRVQPDCLKWCNAICPGDTVHCARVPACPLDTGNIPFDFRNKEQWPVRVCAAVWSLWGEEKWQMWRLAVEKLVVVGGVYNKKINKSRDWPSETFSETLESRAYVLFYHHGWYLSFIVSALLLYVWVEVSGSGNLSLTHQCKHTSQITVMNKTNGHAQLQTCIHALEKCVWSPNRSLSFKGMVTHLSPLRRNHFLFYPSKRLSSYTCSTHVCPLH